jgi:hypothetical protein
VGLAIHSPSGVRRLLGMDWSLGDRGTNDTYPHSRARADASVGATQLACCNGYALYLARIENPSFEPG